MLLKQEDKESNLFLWLLVYFAEDLDIKKNLIFFYLTVQRKPICSLWVLLKLLFVKVAPCGFNLKALFSEQSRGPSCTRPSAAAAVHRPVGTVIQRSLKPLHGGRLEGIHHQRHQVPREAAAALRAHWVPLVRHGTGAWQRRNTDANRATEGVLHLGRADEGSPPGKKNVSGVIVLTEASKNNYFL